MIPPNASLTEYVVGQYVVKSIEARDVIPGDEMLNPYARHPSEEWVRVTRVETRGDQTRLENTSWGTTRGAYDDVRIKRRVR